MDDFLFETGKQNYVEKNNKAGIVAVIIAAMLLIVFFSIKHVNKRKVTNSNSDIENSELQEGENDLDKYKIEAEGFKIAGKIIIPKLNMERYYVKKNKNALKSQLSVFTFDISPGNEGNLVIIGHNKPQLFLDIDNLEESDEIILINNDEQSFKYIVKEKEKIQKTDFTKLTSKNSEKILTLITCTDDELERVLIKAELE